MKRSFGENVFDVANTLLFILLTAIFVYPFINILVISLNDPYDAMRGGIYFWPRSFSISNYKKVLSDSQIFASYGITIARTVIGTLSHLICTGIFAYGMSKKNLVGRKWYTIFCTIPMFFSGGLIPKFILMRTLHLTNTFWVYIIPALSACGICL